MRRGFFLFLMFFFLRRFRGYVNFFWVVLVGYENDLFFVLYTHVYLSYWLESYYDYRFEHFIIMSILSFILSYVATFMLR